MFAVVVIHVSSGVVMDYGRIDMTHWLAGNIADSASRWGVPVFAMLSGSLLLDPRKKESPGLFFAKRGRRVVIPLVFWSVVCYGWFRWRAAEVLTPGDAVFRVVFGSHLYFLYILVLIYCLTPWLRERMRAGRPAGWMMSVFFLLVGILNALVYYYPGRGEPAPGPLMIHFLFFAAGFCGYFTAGYYLIHLASAAWVPRLLPAMAVSSVLAVAAGTYYLVGLYGPQRTGIYLYDYFSPPVIVMSMSVFTCVINASETWSRGGGKISPAIRVLADSSFGVYLMHPFIQDLATRFLYMWKGGTCLPSVNPWMGLPLLSAVVYGVCVAVTVMLRRTPGVRAVVGG